MSTSVYMQRWANQGGWYGRLTETALPRSRCNVQSLLFAELFFRFLAGLVTVGGSVGDSFIGALAVSNRIVPHHQEDISMLPRISRIVLPLVVAAGLIRAEVAHAQKMEAPLQLTSLEWLVADSAVVVRGVVVEVAAYSEWNIVTLDVLETLKGDKVQRLKFAAHKFEKGNAALAKSKQAKQELLWILKRQDLGVPGEAPDRESLMARHKFDLYAPFLPGRPGEPSLPAVPIDSQEPAAGQQPLAFLTIDLRLLKTSDDIVKAIRTAIAETQGRDPVRSYGVALPQEIAKRTGFSRYQNVLLAPIDVRLEHFARRLVLSPGEFLGKDDPYHRQVLRLEGVKALRLFQSERNLAIVRVWLDDPSSTQPFKDDRKTLVPAIPRSQKTEQKVSLPATLADVPEIHFQRPLAKAMKTEHAQLHTAVTIDSVYLLNQKKTDAFIAALMSKRPDLAGLSFAMGDACRMKPAASQQFVAALDVFRKAESVGPSPPSGFSADGKENNKAEESRVMKRYMDLLKDHKIDPSASVASLMQVLGPEDGKTRLGLVKYLDGLIHADATRALAKLAIFSAEPEVRTAAVEALKKRDGKDYTDLLVAALKYPWPTVAERSSEAMVKLGRKDLLPHLIDVLERPDPRAPQSQETNGKKVSVVRELVRVNHHHNCLLCHAPATATRDHSSQEETAKLEGLTAQVPVPSESMVAYYRPSSPDILVRFDVTYLRQDFSMKLPVADADPWPEMQRYDFLVRTREVTAEEALAYQELLQLSRPEGVSPYRRAALSALRELTGLDTEATAAAWRKLTGQ
jgi:hypothetical protein